MLPGPNNEDAVNHQPWHSGLKSSSNCDPQGKRCFD